MKLTTILVFIVSFASVTVSFEKRREQENIPSAVAYEGLKYQPKKVQHPDPLNPEYDNQGYAWTPEGAVGYSKASFEGQTAIWKESSADEWYEFVIFKDVITQLGKRNLVDVPITSVELPKGFELKYEGKISIEKFNQTLNDQQMKELSQKFREGQNSRQYEGFGNIKYLINDSYWYMKMRIIAHEFVKITRKIPKFLTVCIEYQQLHIRKGQLKKKIEEAKANCQANEKELKSLEEKLIEYKFVLIELKVSIEKLTVIYEKIIKINRGEIQDFDWTEEAKKILKENQSLTKEIEDIEVEIKKLQHQINDIEKTILDLKLHNDKLNSFMDKDKSSMIASKKGI